MKKILCEETSEYLELYIDNELSEELRFAVEIHLEECPVCQQKVKMLQEVDEFGKVEFYSDPGDEYWNSVTARIMDSIPARKVVPISPWRTVRYWFESPVHLRRAAYGAAAAVLIMAGLQFSGILFNENSSPGLADNREAGFSVESNLDSDAGSRISGGSLSAGEETPKETVRQSAVQREDRNIKNAVDKTVSAEDAGEKAPYVPKQLTVAPKPPTADNNPPALEDPFKGKQGPAENIQAERKEEESRREELAAAPGLGSTPQIRNPRIPKQGISAFDQSGTGMQGIAGFQQKRISPRNFRSSTRLSDMGTQQQAKRQSIGSSDLTDIELLQNKIILLEVLQTGKDRKIRDVALLQLDEIYRELLSRNPSGDSVREVKGFYSIYKKELIEILGLDEYSARLERLE